MQIEGLKILSRLFIGKKRKPLPGKTQSLPYTTEQLLFGTVSFTILLFLLPTTLIYYFVFTTVCKLVNWYMYEYFYSPVNLETCIYFYVADKNNINLYRRYINSRQIHNVHISSVCDMAVVHESVTLDL